MERNDNKTIYNNLNEIIQNQLIDKETPCISMFGYLGVIFGLVSLTLGILSRLKLFHFKRKSIDKEKILLGRSCSYCNTLYFNIDRCNCKNCGSRLDYTYIKIKKGK